MESGRPGAGDGDQSESKRDSVYCTGRRRAYTPDGWWKDLGDTTSGLLREDAAHRPRWPNAAEKTRILLIQMKFAARMLKLSALHR